MWSQQEINTWEVLPETNTISVYEEEGWELRREIRRVERRSNGLHGVCMLLLVYEGSEEERVGKR